MSPEVISVKEFIGILNETMQFAYPQVVVEGEISGYKVNQGKWVFFDLKDDDATLSCFMPIYYLKVELEDGMKVRVSGSPKLTKWGKFSFTAKSVTLAGEGELRRAYELLKTKLDSEGLFAPDRKRPLPLYPKTIGLITSGTSAAYQDFLKIINQRWAGLKLVLADVQVQGEAAPAQVVGALEHFNQMAEVPDVLVVIRGGGSLEDLQAFNTEQVARAIAASRIPTIVGVGHETDTSLADLAADVRAATPTDAARLAVPDKNEFLKGMVRFEDTMLRGLKTQFSYLNQQLHRQFMQIQNRIGAPFKRVQEFEAVLKRDLNYFDSYLSRGRQQIGGAESALVTQQQSLATRNAVLVRGLERVLSSFSPSATLKRGYAIVRSKGEVVSRASQLSTNDMLMIQLAQGRIDSEVKKIHEK